jgi:hypothetical protein
MAAPRKLTPKQETRLVADYANGGSLSALTEAYGVSAGTIRAIVVRNGGTLRPVGRPKVLTSA